MQGGPFLFISSPELAALCEVYQVVYHFLYRDHQDYELYQERLPASFQDFRLLYRSEFVVP